MSQPLLNIDNLHVHFNTSDGVVEAINGASLTLNPGEIVGLVGESGSGKSVTAMSVLGLVPKPPAIYPEGRILWKGIDLLKTPDRDLREIRGGEISMIFQDPMTSLNPVYTIGHQISEMIRVHQRVSARQAKEQAIEMLELVGVPKAKQRVDDYPHQFSGGMRQRAMIAMALACRPKLLIADEPTTALDVTIQAQIIELMLELKERRKEAAILLITHDLAVVEHVADVTLFTVTRKVRSCLPGPPHTPSPLNPTPMVPICDAPMLVSGVEMVINALRLSLESNTPATWGTFVVHNVVLQP